MWQLQGERDQDSFSPVAPFALLTKHLSVHLLMGHKAFCLLASCPALATPLDNAFGSRQSLAAASQSVCPSPLTTRAPLCKLPAQPAAVGWPLQQAELRRSVTFVWCPAYLTVYGPTTPETLPYSPPLPHFGLLCQPGGFVSSCSIPLKHRRWGRRWEFLRAVC